MVHNKEPCYGFKLLCPQLSLATATLRSANCMQRRQSQVYDGPEVESGAHTGFRDI